MKLKINPTKNLNGVIVAPGSKSYSHRAFIAACLAEGISVIKNPLISGDVQVTIDILKKLGTNVLKHSGNSYIVGRKQKTLQGVDEILDCKNSGTSIRIFSALSLLIPEGLKLSGEFIKRDRPLTPLLEALTNLGAEYKVHEDYVHIYRKSDVCQPIAIPGNISSQFITALLLLSPIISCTNQDFLKIETTSPMASYPYIKITLDILHAFGINVQEKIDEKNKGTFLITSDQHYRPLVYTIPGDFSSAAFILVAGLLAGAQSEVIINNLNMENPQGDKKIVEIIQNMGADIHIKQNDHQIIIRGCQNPEYLQGIEIDCKNIPDLVPILSVLGAYAQGKTILTNIEHVRLKESDRVAVMARELGKMGVKLEESKNQLIIHHCDHLIPSEINHEHDHRIAMSCCIASLFMDKETTINDIEVVKDSYPTFINDLKKLGANISII